MNVVYKVVDTQEKLQVFGYIPLNTQENQNVTFCSVHRHSWYTTQHPYPVIPFFFSLKLPPAQKLFGNK